MDFEGIYRGKVQVLPINLSERTKENYKKKSFGQNNWWPSPDTNSVTSTPEHKSTALPSQHIAWILYFRLTKAGHTGHLIFEIANICQYNDQEREWQKPNSRNVAWELCEVPASDNGQRNNIVMLCFPAYLQSGSRLYTCRFTDLHQATCSCL
jgi:hypothetical protein